MSTVNYRKILTYCQLTALVSNCNLDAPPKRAEKMNEQTHTIIIGEPASNYVKRNGLMTSNIDSQPAGLNFYESKWGAQSPQKVLVSDQSASAVIPFAISVTGTEDTERLSSGLFDVSVSALLKSSGPILHEHAKSFVYNSLSELTNSGWQPFYDYSSPRLTGTEGALYYRKHPHDANYPHDYVMPLEEWVSEEIPTWEFFSKTTHLSLSIHREADKNQPEVLGSYLMVYQFQTLLHLSFKYFEFEDRERWQELWPLEVTRLLKIRQQKEIELIENGVAVNTDFSAPIIDPNDPVVPPTDSR